MSCNVILQARVRGEKLTKGGTVTKGMRSISEQRERGKRNAYKEKDI